MSPASACPSPPSLRCTGLNVNSIDGDCRQGLRITIRVGHVRTAGRGARRGGCVGEAARINVDLGQGIAAGCRYLNPMHLVPGWQWRCQRWSPRQRCVGNTDTRECYIARVGYSETVCNCVHLRLPVHRRRRSMCRSWSRSIEGELRLVFAYHYPGRSRQVRWAGVPVAVAVLGEATRINVGLGQGIAAGVSA